MNTTFFQISYLILKHTVKCDLSNKLHLIDVINITLSLSPIEYRAKEEKNQKLVTFIFRLNNHFGETVFQCSVFQCNDMMTSAFQIYFDGKVVAVGHLINSEQLPLPTQVRIMVND